MQLRTWIPLLLATFALPVSAAASSCNLTLNTVFLQDVPAPLQLDFQLTGSSSNTTTLNNFNFGGGSGIFASSGVNTTVSPGSIVMADSAGSARYFLSFHPGTVLSFDLSTTNNGPATGSTPDQFTMALLDTHGEYIPTTDAGSYQDFLVVLPLTGGALQFQTFASTATPPFSVTPISSPAVPEPSSLSLLGTGLLGTLLVLLRRAGVSDACGRSTGDEAPGVFCALGYEASHWIVSSS